ncbi:MAG TPA: ATPase, T2SS/T4P/T4SS family [Aggregatilineales bacterium]|nr:ATPase, T2SS/T4P/T4SS family [Aggregatilineales bacterium]
MSNGNARKLYYDKMRNRKYTLDALREQIQDEFLEETSGRSDILEELDTREKRIAHLTEVADYVLAREYVTLPQKEKQEIIEQVVANVFYFGSLDPFLRDPEITEITIESPLNVHVRRGFADMESVKSPFETVAHMEQILAAMIAPAGTTLSRDFPFVEVGLNIHHRRARLSLIGPPISPMYSIQIRLHGRDAIPLDSLVPDVVPQSAADLLMQILAAGRGLMVTGEVGVGKTTLIAALLNTQTDLERVVVVERAAEMQLNDSIQHLAAIPHRADSDPVDFATQIMEAVDHHTPGILVLDEIRGDESDAFWHALHESEIPQLMIAFRGTSNPARLHSAISMAIRKHQFSLESDTINTAILGKMPFVIALHHFKGASIPRLSLLGQWIMEGDSLKLESLITWGANGDPLRTDAPLRLE